MGHLQAGLKDFILEFEFQGSLKHLGIDHFAQLCQDANGSQRAIRRPYFLGIKVYHYPVGGVFRHVNIIGLNQQSGLLQVPEQGLAMRNTLLMDGNHDIRLCYAEKSDRVGR